MTSTEIFPVMECPHCAHKLDRVTSDDSTSGKLVGVCMYCGALLIFDGGFPRKPTAEEVREAKDSRFATALERMQNIVREHNSKQKQ